MYVKICLNSVGHIIIKGDYIRLFNNILFDRTDVSLLSRMVKSVTKLNYFCYNRLKLDELGLACALEELTTHTLYESYYQALDFESEKLYRFNNSIPIRTDYVKAVLDYNRMTDGCLGQLSSEASWHQMVALTAVAKIFIRRYRYENPLFASMFCVEFLERINEFGEADLIAWRRVTHLRKTNHNSYKRRQLFTSALTIGGLLCLFRIYYTTFCKY